MLILRHNELSAEDLFVIERRMLKLADPVTPFEQPSNDLLFDKSRAEIYGTITGFFQRLDLCRVIGVSPSEFLDFLIDVDQGYHANAYHSFYHAADITIVLFHMLYNYDVACYLSCIDIAMLLISGLCHDIGHPGKNNIYQVNLKTEIAQRFNNKSVLESYSASMAMDLLTKHGLLRGIKYASSAFGHPTSEADARVQIIRMILATDMVFHYELQENLTGLLEMATDSKEPSRPLKDLFHCQGEQSPLAYFESKFYFEDVSGLNAIVEEEICAKHKNSEGFEPPPHSSSASEHRPSMQLTKYQRQVLCEIVLHAADISNALRPWPVCKVWSDRICEELFQQGDAERLQNLAVSPNMDRNQTKRTSVSLQFCDFVVSPYFEVFVALFPRADETLKELEANRKFWTQLDAADEEDTDDRGRLPNHLLPDRPILNPSGRRVSIAAGMVVIPDELEERTIGSGSKRRRYWGVRIQSQDDVHKTERPLRRRLEELGRRRSDEPTMQLAAMSSSPSPFLPRGSNASQRSYSSGATMCIAKNDLDL